MAMTSIESNGDTILSEIYIDAPPELVFEAIVDPELVVKWWEARGQDRAFAVHSLNVIYARAESGGAPESMSRTPFEAFDEYVEVDPPRLLVQTWVARWTAQVQTTVRWELQPKDQGTLVKHRHCALSTHPEVAKSFRGWPRILGWLQAFLEKSETVDDRWSEIAP